MQVQAQVGTPLAQRARLRWKDPADVRIPLEQRSKPVLDHHRDRKIRPGLPENGYGRRGENAVSHRANPHDRASPIPEEAFEDRAHAGTTLLLNAGFVDPHPWNVLRNRISS